MGQNLAWFWQHRFELRSSYLNLNLLSTHQLIKRPFSRYKAGTDTTSDTTSELVPHQTPQTCLFNPSWKGQLRIRLNASAQRCFIDLKVISPSLAPWCFRDITSFPRSFWGRAVLARVGSPGNAGEEVFIQTLTECLPGWNHQAPCAE